MGRSSDILVLMFVLYFDNQTFTEKRILGVELDEGVSTPSLNSATTVGDVEVDLSAVF